ncbi:MAG: ribosome maturation factor RimP [Pseudoflavonifractor sp.]
MAKVTDLTERLATPIAAENGCSVWDVEYIKEAGTWFLRVYIDKPDGISINDCEAVSRALSDALDEADPIEASYTLEVSSAGMDRVLKKPEHFAAYLGSEVEVRLYRPIAGRKDHVGILLSCENGDVTLDAAEVRETYLKKDVAQVRLYVRV